MAKYRIVEITDGNGSVEYVVERRFLFFWYWVVRDIASKSRAEEIVRSKTIGKRIIYIDQDA